MMAFLIAEEPSLGWGVFLLIVAACAVVSVVLGGAVFLAGWLAEEDDDEDPLWDSHQKRRDELKAAALGKRWHR